MLVTDRTCREMEPYLAASRQASPAPCMASRQAGRLIEQPASRTRHIVTDARTERRLKELRSRPGGGGGRPQKELAP